MESPVKIVAIFVHLICIIKSQKYLSHDGTPSQSTTFTWTSGPLGARLAVNGGPTNDFNSRSCATTDGNQYKAWWMLAFSGNTIYFTNVKIFYRNNTLKRLAGYSLYVTNSSVTTASPKPTNGHRCFHHTGTTLPSMNQTVDCNVLGQYIVIYNERNRTASDNTPGYSATAWLELCDVQIYGCHKTWFGEDCNQQCSLKCTDQHCYPGNGSCAWGCNCLKVNCDNSTICTEGCSKGYAAQYCNQYNLASFGIATQQPTQGHPSLAIDSNRTAGSCSKLSGSETWWQVDLGKLSVIKKIYIYISDAVSGGDIGPNVYATNTSGSWTDGMLLTMTLDLNNSLPILSHYADPFIMGRYIIYVPRSVNVDLCEVEVVGCPVGRFGQDCNQTCPENCHGSCHLETGRCIYGCNNGWLNQYCNESCAAGTFGSQCLEDCHCSNVSFPCNHVHGTCLEGGCQRGYKGSSCNIECSFGTFGYNCEDSCEGCLLDTCDKRNGTCTDQSGCKPGWQPKLPMCDLVCDDGYYGNCTTNCHCRNGIVCDKPTGICPDNQCDQGWMGSTCNNECYFGTSGFNCEDKCDTCSNSTCERIDGNCTNGCIGGYSGYQCQLRVEQAKPDSSSSSSGTIVGIVAAVLGVGVIVVIVFLLRLKANNKKTKYQDNGQLPATDVNGTRQMDRSKHNYYNVDPTTAGGPVRSSYVLSEEHEQDMEVKMHTKAALDDHVDDEDEHVEDVYTNVVSNENTTKYKIPVTELHAYIEKKQINKGFEKEYAILPKGLILPHSEGSKKENNAKNRYLEAWPYDHSRVILKGHHDYINASYIDNYTKERAYIATQGPKNITIKDFWQMIWQENVEVIVMVTKLEEGRKKKCDLYWPESTTTPCTFGNYKVILTKEKEQSVNIYRVIKVINKEEQTERTIHHFHFTQWSDHGVPDKIALVSFYRRVKRAKLYLNGPMVVHCSAGVGRTGTFIAIDALHEHGQKTGYIDIMEYVQMMRKDRMNMIQTKEQYTAVFEALLEAFTIPNTAINTDSFLTSLEEQQNRQVPQNQSHLKIEFQKLQDVKPVYSDDSFVTAKSKENIHKNSVHEILPNDSYRPFLMSYERSRNNYINAVIIPEYVGMNKFLVTQYPLKDTVVDFWTMVYDHECSVVVILESVNENIPLSPNKDTQLEFEVFKIGQSTDKSHDSFNVIINHKGKNDIKAVDAMIMEDWNTTDVPTSENCMLELISRVSRRRKQRPGSVAVVCRNGCDRSGLFVALSLVLEKIEMDDEVDIFQVVRGMQIRRPEFFSNVNEHENVSHHVEGRIISRMSVVLMEETGEDHSPVDQYEYCYKTIKEHMTADSLYANV